MSAFYAATFDDRVEILTDGATYDDEGRVVKTGPKVWTSDEARIAFAGRGSSASVEMLGTIMKMLATCGSFDKTFMAFKEKIEARRNLTIAVTGAVDGIIAGLSETLGPVIFYFHTYTGEDRVALSELEPFTMYDAGTEISCGTEVTARELRDSGLPCFFFLDGLLEHGATYFDLMRRKKMSVVTHPHLPPVYGIGGHVDWTLIAANGVETMRIHEWPDVVGQTIDPDLAGREPPFLPIGGVEQIVGALGSKLN